jgi:hypothetical protein
MFTRQIKMTHHVIITLTLIQPKGMNSTTLNEIQVPLIAPTDDKQPTYTSTSISTAAAQTSTAAAPQEGRAPILSPGGSECLFSLLFIGFAASLWGLIENDITNNKYYSSDCHFFKSGIANYSCPVNAACYCVDPSIGCSSLPACDGTLSTQCCSDVDCCFGSLFCAQSYLVCDRLVAQCYDAILYFMLSDGSIYTQRDANCGTGCDGFIRDAATVSQCWVRGGDLYTSSPLTNLAGWIAGVCITGCFMLIILADVLINKYPCIVHRTALEELNSVI